jgi:hypothetical protein
MSKLSWLLMWLYMTGAAAFGGWRGQELWSDWVIWCFLLPPLAWGVLKIIGEWRRNPYWLTIKVGLLMTGMLVVVMGGLGLGFAAIAANATVKWSASPMVRVIESIAVVAVGVALTWATKGFRGTAELVEISGSENTKAPAESEPTPERRGS